MKEKMNNKIKLKWKNIILILMFLILFITLNISIYNIIKWKLDSNKTHEEIITIVDKREYQILMDYIITTDPAAFVTVYNVSTMRYVPKIE